MRRLIWFAGLWMTALMVLLVVAVMADEVALTVTDNHAVRIVVIAFAVVLVWWWLLSTVRAMMRCVGEEGA